MPLIDSLVSVVGQIHTQVCHCKHWKSLTSIISVTVTLTAVEVLVASTILVVSLAFNAQHQQLWPTVAQQAQEQLREFSVALRLAIYGKPQLTRRHFHLLRGPKCKNCLHKGHFGVFGCLLAKVIPTVANECRLHEIGLIEGLALKVFADLTRSIFRFHDWKLSLSLTRWCAVSQQRVKEASQDR